MQLEKLRARKMKISQMFQRDLGGPVPAEKIFRFSSDPNHRRDGRVPHLLRGALAIVTNVGRGMRWTRICF
jgi:hypothetical protein